MLKVLVVEDSAPMRGLITSILAQLDECEVEEVDSGYEALRRLPRGAFALVVTDINMPDINGLELISYIRRNPSYANTPIVIVSTEASEKDRDKGLALGANAYLTKPFEPEELLTIVRDLLG